MAVIVHCMGDFVFERAMCIKVLFWPPLRLKNLKKILIVIRTIAQVYKSDNNLTFTIAMVTKMTAKTRLKIEK